jgi:hypothetical protein
MWRYSYRREFFPDDALVAGCNALGDAGWSLIGPPRWVPPEYDAHGTFRSAGIWSCFFKRTVSTREQLKRVFALPLEREEATP